MRLHGRGEDLPSRTSPVAILPLLWALVCSCRRVRVTHSSHEAFIVWRSSWDRELHVRVLVLSQFESVLPQHDPVAVLANRHCSRARLAAGVVRASSLVSVAVAAKS